MQPPSSNTDERGSPPDCSLLLKESCYNIWIERNDAWYVYNGVSGGLLRITSVDYDRLKSFLGGGNEGLGCSVGLVADLIEGRMLIPSDANELKFLESRYRAGRRNSEHFSLTIVTSLGCNFDCPYCFEAKHPSILSPDVEQAVLRLTDEKILGIKSMGVSWFGGEPLVGKRPLLALSDSFIQRCDLADVSYSASIVTNGFLLDEETCSQLRDRRVKSAQISLDGPPQVHDRMRPLADGRGSFQQIVNNLVHAVTYFDVTVRMNVDRENFRFAEDLLKILSDRGLSGKLTIYIGQLIAINDGIIAPSTLYQPRCFTNAEYAEAKLKFSTLAEAYGFTSPAIPSPTSSPCTAVRENELIVGSDGELYKCYESIGNRLEVIGDIRSYGQLNSKVDKWLQYDPFTNCECRSCIALPVCMGGCAHHAMDKTLYNNRCDGFRYTHRSQILRHIEMAEQGKIPKTVASEVQMEKQR